MTLREINNIVFSSPFLFQMTIFSLNHGMKGKLKLRKEA